MTTSTITDLPENFQVFHGFSSTLEVWSGQRCAFIGSRDEVQFWVSIGCPASALKYTEARQRAESASDSLTITSRPVIVETAGASVPGAEVTLTVPGRLIAVTGTVIPREGDSIDCWVDSSIVRLVFVEGIPGYSRNRVIDALDDCAQAGARGAGHDATIPVYAD